MDKEYIPFDEFKELYSNLVNKSNSIEDMRKTEGIMISKPTEIIYMLLVNNDVISELINQRLTLQDPVTIQDYYKNVKEIKKEFDQIIKFADTIGDRELYEGQLYSDDVKNSFKNLLNVYDKILTYFETCAKIDSLKNQDISSPEYYRLTTKLNKRLVSTFNTASKMVPEDQVILLGDKAMYEKITEAFTLMALKYEFYYCGDKEEKNITSSLIKPQICNAEKQRLDYIKKTNDLYQELYIDWIRDLDSQVPFSTRDKAKLIKAKYEKLGERFNMPLANSSSIGMVKEVYNQINNLMNSISDLSSESYSIGTYRE